MQGGPREKRSPMVWMAIGCGVLFFSVTCCGGLGAAFFAMQAQRQVLARAEAARMAAEQERQERERELAEMEAGPTDPAPPADGDPLGQGEGPLSVTMTVTAVDGVPGVSVGTLCTFEVSKRQFENGARLCEAHVVCNGQRLYGETETNGAFPCTLTASSVVGVDHDTTASDTDPAFSIDTTAGTLSIADDASGHLGAFHVTASVSTAQGPGLGLTGVGAAS